MPLPIRIGLIPGKGHYLVIHDAKIESYTLPGGAVSDLTNDVAQATANISKATAPQRYGTLVRGIGWSRAKPQGYGETAAEVRSTARHSLWVIEGTTGPITSTRPGGWLLVDGWLPRKSVRGQAPNYFMHEALAAAMRLHT